MFEGLVRQLILGYLGQYVKDIQKEQLKITLWNEEVLLENVELILEAFEYLQLPFALKEGRVGRLSIKIPWKKLGWDPIIITLEDVFVCASQRDEREWSLEEVEKREFAGKKAKLAAAELAKLSRRVCDNQAGQSFISYITAKILDSIQVSIRNFHVSYRATQNDVQSDLPVVVLGLRFSSLTIMKQTSVGMRGQVNKTVEISGLEVYCSSCSGASSLVTIDSAGVSKSLRDGTYDGNQHQHILSPLDVSVLLSVNRSGKLNDDAPQYSVGVEITHMVMRLDEFQLRQILILLDDLCICRLREKYGRYRPLCSPSGKPNNWQRLWWQYAQQSVLSDVRKRLRRTSWKYFGLQLSYRRKYVNLYKKKLLFLKQDQLVDEEVLGELEQMEKESDIDDILSYRSTAERELQEHFSGSPASGSNSLEKSRNDPSGKSRGWLNWLSRGMLGAGGTEDSSQFSGIVSDEVIKDIYEATEFDPRALINGDDTTNEKMFKCSFNLFVQQISATVGCTKSWENNAELLFEELSVECKLWEDSATMAAAVGSVRIIRSYDQKVIIVGDMDNLQNAELPSCKISINVLPAQELGLSLKVMIQPLKITFDVDFLSNCMAFFGVFKSFKFQHDRVLSSLNGVKDNRARILSKAQYALSSPTKVAWEVSVLGATLNVPWGNACSECSQLVFQCGNLSLKSIYDLHEDESHVLKKFLASFPKSDFAGIQFRHLYDHFEIALSDAGVILVKSSISNSLPILEKFSFSVILASSIIPDEELLKQLEVFMTVSLLRVHFSPTIQKAAVELIMHGASMFQQSELASVKGFSPSHSEVNSVDSTFDFAIAVNLGTMHMDVNLENEDERGYACLLCMQDMDVRCDVSDHLECWVRTKALKVISYLLKDEKENHTLCSFGAFFEIKPGQPHFIPSDSLSKNDEIGASLDPCFLLHYETCREEPALHRCVICLNDGDLHIYPHIVSLLVEFFDRIAGYNPNIDYDSGNMVADKPVLTALGLGHQRFGFSNFVEVACPENESIHLDHFPFITTKNSGFLSDFNSSPFGTSDWRRSFTTRTRRSRSPKSCMRNGSKMVLFSSLKSFSGVDTAHGYRSGHGSEFIIDISFFGVRVHFHDSSCIVGTITLPMCKSAVFVYGQSIDILCSTEGLTLMSSWTKRIHELLWGPATKNLHSILNVRVRIRNAETNPETEISIGLQHVCCTLPSEYLAILIGYFSLPDWISNSSKQLQAENSNNLHLQQSIIYKFEILDSILITPVENGCGDFLKLEIPMLYSTFVPDITPNNVLEGIPFDCLVPERKVAKRNHALNVFGRQLALSLLLVEDCEDGRQKIDQDALQQNLVLVSPLSADVWVRIPREDGSVSESYYAPTCIMGKIEVCEVIVDDSYLPHGIGSVIMVADQFSSVVDESKAFTCDVLQFLQAKKCQTGSTIIEPLVPTTVLTEVLLSVDTLTIKTYHSLKDSVNSEPVVQTQMQFGCSVSLRNNTTESMAFSFSSLAVYSSLTSVALAKCTSTSSSSVLGIKFSKSEVFRDEISIFLPSLHIWLELVEWTKILDSLNIFAGQLNQLVLERSSLNDPVGGSMVGKKETASSECSCPVSDCNILENREPDKHTLLMRSESICITFHFPFLLSDNGSGEYGRSEFEKTQHHRLPSIITGGKQRKDITLTLFSKNTELYSDFEMYRLKSYIEKASASAGIYEEDDINRTWPFLQIFKVSVEAEVYIRQTGIVHVATDIRCDHTDIGLSHKVFYFFRHVELDFPEGGSPQMSIDSIDCKIQIRKVSVLLTDGRWRCSGPLLEILTRNLIMHANATKTLVECSVAGDMELNYNNIYKVMWEPFMEPWKFQLDMTRRREVSILLNSSILTDIHFMSMAPLNLNCTESLLECFCRAIEMVQDAWDLNQSNNVSKNCSFFEAPVIDNISAGRYAPYILQNLTSLPLTYQILQGSFDPIEALVQDMEYSNSVLPDSFVPIYIKETPEEQLLRFRPAHSSDRLNEKQSIGVTHHFIRIQLDGTAPSVPISMDLVGISYFEVDFSKEPNRLEPDRAGEVIKKTNDVDGDDKNGPGSGFVLPVVFDVSISRFSKLIRIHSTVILLNETSLPLELRFDIPLGVSPKIIDPIHPGQKFPLPLHLAEAGRVRWRPLGGSYVWSEAHNLSNILSQESNIGSHRSFVCYPSHPSSDPFRCCLAIEKISLPSSKKARQVSSLHSRGKQSMNESDPSFETDVSRQRFIYQLMLCTPLVVHNYLPEAISLTIDSGGVSHSVILSEVDSFFHHIDPSHDLGLVVHMQGFQPSISRFPHMESFSAQARFIGGKFTQTETVTFDPVDSNCPIYVTVEKTMDAFSGARELFLFVPFLLYNCVGFPLSILVSANDVTETVCTIPSCYSFVETDLFDIKKDGLSLFSSDESSYGSSSRTNPMVHLSMKNPIFSNRRNLLKHGVKLPGNSSALSGPISIEMDKCSGKNETKSPSTASCSSYQSTLIDSSIGDNNDGKAKPCAFSPSPTSDNIVRISKHLPEDIEGRLAKTVWSNPFPLFPPSGPTSALIPLPEQNAAYILSVSSVTVPEQLTGRTRAITFQPRYVICNACSKDLRFKQKGTKSVFYLGIGQHSHLHWTDTTRDLLISICYNEPGWQWSGSFLPDILGDTQVKMWNHVSGALSMIRVEVQNADMSMKDGKIATSLHRISGTNLILLSDDDTGYMPYRIENFSKERLRIYQQRCENFETIIHPYQSSPYAWDEPCYPHRLTVEVPGERVLGSYALDDVKDIITVHLPSTSEKPDRTLLISIRAEGATKVLSVVDSTYHVNMSCDNKKYKEQASFSDYKESLSIYIPHIGVSLISSLPQEMIFACAKGISLDLLRSVDRQKLSFQVLSLQIDNQLRATPYPVILSFDHDYRIISVNPDGSPQSRYEDLQLHSNVPCEPAFHFSLSKWRKKDESLSSFESITLRVADFHLELEQEIVLYLYDFFEVVYSRSENRTLPSSDPRVLPLLSGGHLFNDTEFTHPGLSIDKSKDGIDASLPSIVPIGAPWQHIYHLARRQKKIYVELFDLAPINFSLSFSSAPWMHRIGMSMSADSLVHRGLIALADIEGAHICLKQLTISHHMASWESIQEILVRHYSRQVLHEIYKVFGSAGVIGNPMAFARSLGLGIRDFLSVPLRNILQSPTGLVKGMAQGTTSLLSRTVYALSDAATQFSKAAQKGIVALTFDEQAVAKMEMQQRGATSQSQGVINEVLEGLTGLLQSPIRGAEKHGLPGVLSGAALGLTGLVARPAASILEVTGKTAQSIRNRSKHYQLGAQRRRVRLPRPLNKDLPLRPYSWEEAIGTFVLAEADDNMKLKNEMLVICKALKQAGKFVILTETLILIISCPSLVDFDKPEFRGISANPEWVIESEIALDSVMHADTDDHVVHVVGSSYSASRQNQLTYRGVGTRRHEWNNAPSLPLFQTDLELASKEEADNFLEILLSTIELRKGRGRGGGCVLHQCDIK